MGRFNSAEQAAIAEGRTEFPRAGQRTLARTLYKGGFNVSSIGHPLRFRSEAAIYSALRRHDLAAKRGVTQHTHSEPQPA